MLRRRDGWFEASTWVQSDHQPIGSLEPIRDLPDYVDGGNKLSRNVKRKLKVMVDDLRACRLSRNKTANQ